MLLLMDIQDLEHSPCCTSASCMPAPASNFSGGSVLVLEQTGHSPPKSPLSSSQFANSQPTTTSGHQQSQHHFIRQNSTNNNHNGRPLTSSPYKKGAHNVTANPTNNNIENNGGYRDQPRLHYRQGKSYRFNSHQTGGNNHHPKSGIHRRNNSVLPKVVFHQKQQQSHQSSESPPSKALNESSSSHNGSGPSNYISKSTCDINSGGGGKSNGHVLQQHNSTSKRNYSSKKNSKVDLPINVSKNCKRGNSFEDASTSRPKKTRRSRRRKRPYEGGDQQSYRSSVRRDKRMRWTECNADEVSRLHRNCMQKGQPLAPYNTTQFIMNEHNAEKEIDFDELSGQIQQMHNNRRPPLDSSGGSYDPVLGIAGSDIEDSNRDDYYYSSPEDESYFLEQQFHEAYDTMHAERLNSMSKSDLLKEYLLIEKELESLRQKSPSSSTVGAGVCLGSTGDNSSGHLTVSTVTKSPRPPSMPSSPRGQLLNARAHHHHHCNGNSCSHHRGLFKENKHLRKLLKQVYSRYNSLMYCINYVNTTNTSSNSSEIGAMGYFDEIAGGVGSTSQTSQQQAHQASSQQQQPPPVTPDDYQMTNEMHYRIEKYICHPSPSPLSSSTGSSTSYTSSSSSSTSTSTSITSEDDVQELRHNRHLAEPVVCELLHDLVDRVVVEGN